MPANPPLTIVIPVYNEGANFARSGQIRPSIQTPFNAIVVHDFEQRRHAAGYRRNYRRRRDPNRAACERLRPRRDRRNQDRAQAVKSGPVLVTMADFRTT